MVSVEASAARRIDREMFVLLGGAAALLVQVAHPRVAAAVDRHSDLRRDPFGRLVPMRILMGFGIAFNALTEKLLDPPLSQSLIDRYQFIALNRLVGLPDAAFIWLAGTVELAIGLVIVSGRITRPVVIVGALLFTSTLFVFGWPELLGHLPFFGIMFLLLVAPHADTWHLRRALRPAA